MNTAMGDYLALINDLLTQDKLVFTALLIATFIVGKIIAVRFIKSKIKEDKEDKRQYINMVKNIFNLIMMITMFNIWSNELQDFAFSIAAFVVAIVLATREFIQCFIGFVYIISSRPFRIGDWIQVGDLCGEVHSTDWAKLAIMEVDIDAYQYTGKTLYIPNSVLITEGIKNLNFLKRYAMHTFTIVRDCSVNPFDFLDQINVKAQEYCSDFKDVANRYNQLIENRLDISIAGPEPHIQVATSDVGHTQVFFTIFCPTDRALEIEQQLTCDFMNMWFEHKNGINNKNLRAVS